MDEFGCIEVKFAGTARINFLRPTVELPEAELTRVARERVLGWKNATFGEEVDLALLQITQIAAPVCIDLPKK